MTTKVILFPGPTEPAMSAEEFKRQLFANLYAPPNGVAYYTASSSSTPPPVEDPMTDACPDCPLDKCIRYDPDEPRTCPKDRATGYVGDYKVGHPRRAVPAKVIPLETRRPR